MKVSTGTEGMETHMSMVLLVCALLLISAFAISGGTDDRRDEEAFEIRILQARALASCILSLERPDGRGPVLNHIPSQALPIVIIWTGSEITLVEGGGGADLEVQMICEVIRWTPDGSGSLVTLDGAGNCTSILDGEVATCSADLGNGTILSVSLPLRRGEISCRGVAL